MWGYTGVYRIIWGTEGNTRGISRYIGYIGVYRELGPPAT